MRDKSDAIDCGDSFPRKEATFGAVLGLAVFAGAAWGIAHMVRTYAIVYGEQASELALMQKGCEVDGGTLILNSERRYVCVAVSGAKDQER
jgi:hypothetical protein